MLELEMRRADILLLVLCTIASVSLCLVNEVVKVLLRPN